MPGPFLSRQAALLGAVLCFLATVGVVGCGSGAYDSPATPDPSESEPSAASSSATAESAPAASTSPETAAPAKPQAPFKLGDLAEPFTPPTLAELDAQVKWIDRPVVDALAELRKRVANEAAGMPAAQAIRLPNDSAEANAKILSSLSVLAPADGSGVDYSARINRALTLDLVTTNPILTSSVAESEYLSLTGFGLFSFDDQMQPLASRDAVVSWQTSEDGLYDKVVLRDDLLWSDGKPITAHDVAFSFQAIMTEAVPVLAVRQGTDQMKLVHAYDDHTLVYFHKQAAPTNVWNLNYSVIPKHIYEKSIAEDPTLVTSEYHAKLEKRPVVGGAYELVDWKRSQQIVLKRRENYFMVNGKQVRDKPYFAEIFFRIIEDPTTRLLALKSGDVHESELGAEQWETQTGDADFYRFNTKVRGPEWTFFYFVWNLQRPQFQDRQVRQALAYVMNYDEMIDDLSYGLYPRCQGIFHPDSWIFPRDAAPLYEQDLDRAEDLLDAAGWVDSDGDGTRDKEINGRLVPLAFDMLVGNKPDRIAICELFAEDLANVGIECNVRPLDAVVVMTRCDKKEFDACMSGWGTGTDPFTNENIFGTGEPRNYGSYSNPEVDRLFDAGLKEFDPAKRAEIYGQIHKLIYEDQPYLFLFNRSSFYGFKNTLRGYRFSPRGPFHYSPGFSSIWSVQQ